ncbi:hypothetical protein tb265_07030 [Gemmatimonadetes bacterium T265]|nr:hypothetical protein tb265_07030 [Gemmatimonadetes bacterium T265]
MGDRRTQLTAEVTARLARLCAHRPAERFAAMVADIVEKHLRHEERLFAPRAEPPEAP